MTATDPRQSRIVVVGAGHAGGIAAASLRAAGHAGPLTLIGAEAHAPYQRPPLSKAYLKGEATPESLKLRPDAFYAERGIEMRLGTAVTAIDRQARRVTCDDGSAHGWDWLILATGSTARRLSVPGHDLAGVLLLRGRDDADALRDVLRPGTRVVIAGGGYVGLEAAASARALGAEVTIVEREARLLARVAAEPLATFFAAEHAAHGVEILTGAEIAGLEGDVQVEGVRLGDGRRLACDAVLVGIGGAACDDVARAAGLACDGGVIVDADARTGDAAIFAIGDVSRRPLPLDGGRMHRLESVPNAVEQAKRAANAILGLAQPPHEVPWFWSDQYDLKLQIAGVPFECDALVVRGDPAARRFSVWHLRGGSVRAVEAVGAIPDFMAGKALIADGRPVDAAVLADTAVPAKALLKV